MVEPFELSKIIFSNPGRWQEITPGEKRKNFFILNRRFAIQFPMQANALQHVKINQVGAMDFWQSFMRKHYDRTPGWMYTKGVKKAKEVKERKTTVSKKLIDQYAIKMSMDPKSIHDALEFYPDLMAAELKTFDKMINQK